MVPCYTVSQRSKWVNWCFTPSQPLEPVRLCQGESPSVSEEVDWAIDLHQWQVMRGQKPIIGLTCCTLLQSVTAHYTVHMFQKKWMGRLQWSVTCAGRTTSQRTALCSDSPLQISRHKFHGWSNFDFVIQLHLYQRQSVCGCWWWCEHWLQCHGKIHRVFFV